MGDLGGGGTVGRVSGDNLGGVGHVAVRGAGAGAGAAVGGAGAGAAVGGDDG